MSDVTLDQPFKKCLPAKLYSVRHRDTVLVQARHAIILETKIYPGITIMTHLFKISHIFSLFFHNDCSCYVTMDSDFNKKIILATL